MCPLFQGERWYNSSFPVGKEDSGNGKSGGQANAAGGIVGIRLVAHDLQRHIPGGGLIIELHQLHILAGLQKSCFAQDRAIAACNAELDPDGVAGVIGKPNGQAAAAVGFQNAADMDVIALLHGECRPAQVRADGGHAIPGGGVKLRGDEIAVFIAVGMGRFIRPGVPGDPPAIHHPPGAYQQQHQGQLYGGQDAPEAQLFALGGGKAILFLYFFIRCGGRGGGHFLLQDGAVVLVHALVLLG